MKKQAKTGKLFSIRNMSIIGMLSAVSTVVMLFEFPLWFAPSFYKLDASEVIVLIGAFALGPVAGIIIEFLKIVLNLLINSTTTAYVGEIANFLIGCSLIVPASLIYKKHKTIKFAVIGLVIGTISLTIFSVLMNYFVLLPVYSHFYGAPIDAFIGMGKKVNPYICDLKTLVFFAVAPFNLVKGVLSSLITILVYKKLSPIIKGKSK